MIIAYVRTNSQCPQKCDCSGNFDLTCYSFNDLNLTGYSFNELILKPKTQTRVLNDSLKLSTTGSNRFRLYLHNIESIDVAATPFRSLNLSEIGVAYSNMKFVNNAPSNQPLIFNGLNLESFIFKNVKFINNSPVNLFNNSFIKWFYLIDSSSILTAFQPVPLQFGLLNTTIESVIFEGTQDQDVQFNMDNQLFRKTKNLVFFDTTVRRLDKELVNKIDNPETIHYVPSSQIDGRESQPWLANVSGKVYLDVQYTPITDDSRPKPVYLRLDFQFNNLLEEKNICFFKHIQFHANVIPYVFDIEKYMKLEPLTDSCDCSIYWLFRYYRNYKTSEMIHYFSNNTKLEKCLQINDFNRKVSECVSKMNETLTNCDEMVGKPNKSGIHYIIIGSVVAILFLLITITISIVFIRNKKENKNRVFNSIDRENELDEDAGK